MIVKPGIFRGNEGLFQMNRQLFHSNRRTFLKIISAKQNTVCTVYFAGDRILNALQFLGSGYFTKKPGPDHENKNSKQCNDASDR
jgi:hypothetical protein